MADQFPKNIEFEVSRDSLRSYLRTTSWLMWTIGTAFFGAMIGFATASNQSNNHNYKEYMDFVISLVISVGTGLGISVIISTILYFLFSHRREDKMASSLRVTVEGAFLHIVQEGYSRVDKKIHFRSIVDYTTVDGGLLRRFGIMNLQMTTIGGGGQNTIRILGLKECEKVRDMLAEIDSIREEE